MRLALDRDRLAALAQTYYDACNAGDAKAIAACFTPDARHYFPAGAPQGTFTGASAIGRGWADVVERLDSRWTIDRLVIDVTTREVAIEWTHWKPVQGGHLRGIEICCFDADGLMTEIRAAYAAPASAAVHEYGDFLYAERGYATKPPDVTRRHGRIAGVA